MSLNAICSPRGRGLEPILAEFDGIGDIKRQYIAQMGQKKFE